MTELARYLFLAGAAPFLLLGTAHALHTPRGVADRKGLTPADPALPELMARSGLRLTRRTDVWRAWVGFNFSHSLGAVAFGLAVLLAGRTPEAFAGNAVFVPFALGISLLYLVLGAAYWFRTPIAGISVSAVLFAAAWALA